MLVVNDNSGLARSDNVVTLEASPFAKRGALHIARRPFVHFADMRNFAFAQLGALAVPPDWVLFLDADEVHGAQLRYIARDIAPAVAADVGNIDAYTYHFFGTYRWITDIARRMVLYRYRPEIYWENAVHEKIVGLRGRALVLPYVYHHYGNVVPAAALALKHERYYALGGAMPSHSAPGAATLDVYVAKAAGARRYRAPHPAVARPTLARCEADFAPELAAVEAAFRAARSPAVNVANFTRAALETLRVQLRRVQHPLAYRAPTRGR